MIIISFTFSLTVQAELVNNTTIITILLYIEKKKYIHLKLDIVIDVDHKHKFSFESISYLSFVQGLLLGLTARW